VFQPKIQKGCVFPLNHRTFGLDVQVQVCTPVCALYFGGQLEGDYAQSEGRRVG
jgi:hypothetical protein